MRSTFLTLLFLVAPPLVPLYGQNNEGVAMIAVPQTERTRYGFDVALAGAPRHLRLAE